MKTKFYFFFYAMLLCSGIRVSGQAPGWEWAKSAGGNGDDVVYDMAVDINGNSYLTGYFHSPTIIIGTVFFANTDSSGNTDDIFIVKYDASGNLLWAENAGGIGNDVATAIAVDQNGNTYLTGYFASNTITFDTITLLKTDSSQSVFIVKFNSSGNVLWAKTAGGNGRDLGESIALDAVGNPCITGNFESDTIRFGSSTLINSSQGAGTSDIFIVKYDTSGNVSWAKKAGGNSVDEVRSIAVEWNGDLFITGSFSSSIIAFDSTSLIHFNLSDVFVAKYDAAGNALWAKMGAGTGDDAGSGICVDTSGNSFITGSFNSPALAFASTIITNTDSSGKDDVFIVKYDPLGNVLWAKSEGGSEDDVGVQGTVDGNGNFYVTGGFRSSTVVFDTSSLTNMGGADIFITKYNGSGNVLWAKSMGGTNDDFGIAMHVGTGENLYIAGNYGSSTLAFDNIVLANVSGGSNQNDVFVAKMEVLTAISETELANTIAIFPNPSSGEINISSSFTIDKIEIRDVMGQVVYRAKPNERNVRMQVTQEAGVYFVTVSSQHKTSTQKLVVQR